MKGIITISNSNNNFGESPQSDDVITQIAKRWPEIEAMLESSGRNQELDEDILGYLRELRKDNAYVQWFRNTIIVLSIILIGLLWYYLTDMINNDWTAFFLIGQNARVAFIIGLFSLTGVFITVVLRGAFRMTKDTHKDKLPANLSSILDKMAS